MDRRNFVRLVLAGGGAAVIAPKMVWAGISDQAMAGGVYYTKDAPGRWSAKVKTHSPLIEIKKADGVTTVQIVTPHEMKGYEHYIVKHIMLDKNFKFLHEKLFDPTKDTSPLSSFPLGDYSGLLYALSVCNLHDTWLSVAEA